MVGENSPCSCLPVLLSGTVLFVILVLILRNVTRNLRRLLPMVAVLALSFTALTIGNGVLGTAEQTLYHTYAAHLAGDFSIAPTGEESFTIFGSDMLLVGEFLVPPVLTNFETLQGYLQEHPAVRGSTGVVTALARVEVANTRKDAVVFGVDIAEYRSLFPGITLVAGRWPDPGETAVMVQETSATPDARTSLVGSEALLSVARDNTFTLRTVPVVGVFRYPVTDEMLSRVVLTDPDTARSLNGFVYGAAEVSWDGDTDSSLDDLFGDDGFWDEPEPEREESGDSNLFAEIEQFLSDTQAQDEATQARAAVQGAWNYLLVRTHVSQNASTVMQDLRQRGFSQEAGYLTRDWRRTVGGTAQIVWYLQVMMNGGLLFIAFGAVVIATNALMLSILERTAEIGTMRALGASRQRVAVMISGETAVLVVGSALLGILLGAGGVQVLNALGLEPVNQYMRILFGGQAVYGAVTGTLIRNLVGTAVLLAVFALLYPLKRALSISPVRAMAAA